VVGAVLDDIDFTVELIADGIHLHPTALRLLQRLKGTDKIILITDASPFSGMEPGEYQDRSGNFTVSDRGITAADKTLAGSNLTMMGAVQNMINFTGCTLNDAIRMATINPAKLIGVDQRKGSLERGKDADLVIFDELFNIEQVSFKGNLKHTF
jgi:N-acetylglucosamine-6-phosphate deacetylase